ncbi:MAG: PAS domain-containing protein, partial [Thiohalobacteraceae bacterium]
MKHGPRESRILDGLNTAVLVFDRALRLRYLNLAGETLFGVSARHAAGQTLAALILVDGDLGDLGQAITRILPRAALRAVPPVDEPDAELAHFLGEDEAQRAAHEAAPHGRRAAVAALRYAQETRPGAKLEIDALVRYDPGEHLVLDEVAVRNLELIRTLSGERKGSLLALLDGTRT